MLKVQALNRHKIISFKIVVLQYDVAEMCNLELQTRNIYYGVNIFYTYTNLVLATT